MTPERFERLKAALRRRQPDLTVVMDRVSKSHNFSAILRNCDAAGVLEAHFVRPRRSALPLHYSSSAGTKKWVSVRRHPDVASAVSHLHDRGFTVLAAHPSSRSIDFRQVDYTRPTAILMGTERHGLTDASLELADEHVVVPMMGLSRSLNVSVATSLLLFEAVRQRQAAGMYERSRLSPDAFERKLFEWAYPSVAKTRRAEDRPYPALTDEGELVADE
jgi:tRNA (guanosine-2'-O-)-methyltransferase